MDWPVLLFHSHLLKLDEFHDPCPPLLGVGGPSAGSAPRGLEDGRVRTRTRSGDSSGGWERAVSDGTDGAGRSGLKRTGEGPVRCNCSEEGGARTRTYGGT